MEKEICIGIDLGTTYCCVGIWDNELKGVKILEDEKGFKTTPSYIAFKNGTRLIGRLAKKQDNPIFNVKRIIGKHLNEIDTDDFPYPIVPDSYDYPLIKPEGANGLKFKPEELSAMLLVRMREIAEDKLNMKGKIRNAVITVPAYFNDSQKSATKNAAAIAGLNCIRIINEPTAACLCYGLNKTGLKSKVLIFDLGGGTFDVSIVDINDGVFTVLAVNGNTNLGGEDFDRCLQDYVVEDFLKETKLSLSDLNENFRSKVKTLVELAKQELSEALETEIEFSYKGNEYKKTIYRSEFEGLCKELFESCFLPIEKVLQDAELSKESINEIILVGGSTRIPKIQKMLSEYFNGKTLNKSVHPDEAVAYGASIQGAILTDTDETNKTKDMVLSDVIPLTLGIKTSGGLMTPLIHRNTGIPTEKMSMFTTIEDGQTTVDIEIYEGERKFVTDNHLLSKFSLSGITRGPKGSPKIEVKFFIDSNGILSVTAVDKDTLATNSIVVERGNDKLSNDEIQRMIIEADKYRMQDEIKKDTIEFKNNFIEFLKNQQHIVNASSNILSEEDLSRANQLLLSTMEWLHTPDEDGKYPDLHVIKECRHSVEFYLKPVIEKIYLVSSTKDKDYDDVLTKTDKQKIINNI